MQYRKHRRGYSLIDRLVASSTLAVFCVCDLVGILIYTHHNYFFCFPHFPLSDSTLFSVISCIVTDIGACSIIFSGGLIHSGHGMYGVNKWSFWQRYPYS